ncbi:MAG: ferrous iron transport protein A [Spirochaetes bacterium]|nr:ferrous iron transport protein A [Spirochaetota bacterium]
MPLTYCKPGEQFQITSLCGGQGFIKRLSEMGIYPGVILKVIANSGKGPVIVGLDDTRIGLGQGMAGKIMVKPLNIKEGVR